MKPLYHLLLKSSLNLLSSCLSLAECGGCRHTLPHPACSTVLGDQTLNLELYLLILDYFVSVLQLDFMSLCNCGVLNPTSLPDKGR